MRIVWLVAWAVVAPGLAAGAPAPWERAPLTAAASEVMEVARARTAGETADVAVLYASSDYRLDAEGRQTIRHRLVYRILASEALDSWGLVSARFSPWHQERPSLRARVISPDGGVHPLDAGTLTESPTAAAVDVFEDRRLLQAPLPGLGVGAVVEEEVVLRDVEPFFAGGVVAGRSLAMSVPVYRGRISLDVPESLPLRYVARGLADEPVEARENGRRRVVLDHSALPPWAPPEPGLPASEAGPPGFYFSWGDSWPEVAAAYSDIVDRQIAAADMRGVLEAVGRALPAAGASTFERIGRLLAWVRSEVRYTGLELGAAALLPAPPDRALERRFGDGKDQAALLVSLLRAEGTPAYVALLRAGPGADVAPPLPGLGHFDHALVYVPGAQPLWIDPTDPYSRVGELPGRDQDRLALVASPSTTGLIRTPAATAAENTIVERRRIVLADNGRGRVLETTEYRGAFERRMRRAYAGVETDAARRQLQAYVAESYLAERVGAIDHTAAGDLGRPFRMEIEALESGRAVTDLFEGVVALFPRLLVAELPEAFFDEEAPPRRRPYVFRTPFRMEQRYRIEPPAGMEVRELPEDEHLRLGPAKASFEYRRAGAAVEALFRFDSGERQIEAAAFEELRRGAVELARRGSVLLSFAHLGEVHLAAGEIGEAIRAYRRRVDGAPQVVQHRVRLARALLAGGMQPAALRQARRGIEIDPGSAVAYWMLGWIHTHDEIGRRFGPGYDHAAAVAALREAMERDPANELAVNELAGLLDHDREGVPFGEGADLEAALELHRRLREGSGDAGHDASILRALLRLGRFEELEEASATLSESPLRTRYRLIALAVNHGIERATAEAGRLIEEAPARAAQLAGAAQQLALLGRFPTAAALMRAAARGAPNPGAAQVAARLLDAIRPLSEVPVEPDSPEGLVRRLILSLLTRPGSAEVWSEIFHPRTFERRDAAWLEERLRSASDGGVKQMAQRFLISRRALAEIGLSNTSLEVVGDDRVGYRVRVLSEGLSGRTTTGVWVTRQGGRYWVVASEETLGLAGLEVLHLVDRGEHAAARLWLDQIRQEIVADPSGDPLQGPLLPRFLSPGRPAEARSLRSAAAALMADRELPEVALPILREQLATADGDEARRLKIALYRAHERLGQREKAARLALELYRETGSELAFIGAIGGLGAADRLREARGLVEDRLAERPDDPTALRLLAGLALQEGRPRRATELYARLQELGKADHGIYNGWAWAQLFLQPIPEDTVRLAERAVQLAEARAHDALHTLAAVYAIAGRADAAYRAIVQAVELLPDKRPTAVDWFVLGGIAEAYGLEDDARSYYRRLIPPQPGERHTTAVLAYRRLEALRSRSPR